MHRKFIPTLSAAILAAVILPAAAETKPVMTPPPPAITEAATATVGTAKEAAGAAVKKMDVDAVLAFIPAVAATYGDGKTISGDEIKKMIKPFLKMAAEQGQVPPTNEIHMAVEQATNSLVDIAILKVQCAKDGVTVSQEEAVKKVADIAAENGGDKGLEEGLKRAGMTKEELVSQVNTQLVISKWVDEKVKPTVKVGDAEVEKFYNENKEKFQQPEQFSAAHILIKTEENADESAKKAAKAKAEKILADLKGGADFAKLAQENSACPSGKAKGGDLGSFAKGQMVPEFEEAAAKLKKGELSGVVETPFGYHIIKGGESKPASTMPLAEVKDKLKGFLANKGVKAAMDTQLEELRKAANVKILLPATPKAPALDIPSAVGE